MSRPVEREQLEFLTKLQRLLSEGAFVASYKYALLLALSDLCVEKGDDSGEALRVSVADLSAKFVEYYWPQSAPHPAGGVLSQSTRDHTAIVNELTTARAEVGDSLSLIKRNKRAWRSLVSRVARVVRVMPLLKLQTVGSQPLEFLYRNNVIDKSVELLPGVCFCFRRFHPLIEDLVRGAWVRFVRSLPSNRQLVGEVTDLTAFMFGSGRAPLELYGPVLKELQGGTCFYCGSNLLEAAEVVDHFVPWSLYPVDFGHNFVLADSRCNGGKSDTLAGVVHLAKWHRRNLEHGRAMGAEFDARRLPHDLTATNRVTAWAYENAERAGAQVWLGGTRTKGDYQRASPEWRTIMGS
jgi:5-methylcytosine-specific restriction endonuclease McrA